MYASVIAHAVVDSVVFFGGLCDSRAKVGKRKIDTIDFRATG